MPDPHHLPLQWLQLVYPWSASLLQFCQQTISSEYISSLIKIFLPSRCVNLRISTREFYISTMGTTVNCARSKMPLYRYNHQLRRGSPAGLRASLNRYGRIHCFHLAIFDLAICVTFNSFEVSSRARFVMRGDSAVDVFISRLCSLEFSGIRKNS